MWNKPSIQKPDFLSNMSEKECLEINGGLNKPILSTYIPPITLLSGVMVKPFDIPKPTDISKPIKLK